MDDRTGELPIYTAEVTYRTYDDYLNQFNLDPRFFEKGVRICDLGAGLATFTSEVNHRFNTYGTSCVGVDPSYEVLTHIDPEADP